MAIQEFAHAQSPDAATAQLKVPPHSVEAEQALLGGLMLDNGAWDDIADLVSEDDLYRRNHRLIFTAIGRRAARGAPGGGGAGAGGGEGGGARASAGGRA